VTPAAVAIATWRPEDRTRPVSGYPDPDTARGGLNDARGRGGSEQERDDRDRAPMAKAMKDPLAAPPVTRSQTPLLLAQSVSRARPSVEARAAIAPASAAAKPFAR
jgi:hypothetical protein